MTVSSPTTPFHLDGNFQPVATESDYLLTLRGGGLGNMPGSTKCILHTTEHETFPGARAAAE